MDEKKLLRDLFRAYYDARKNKRGTLNALRFEMEFEKNLFELCDELLERRYQIRPSICFINLKPVKREIFAADFRDRIVHHLVHYYINFIFEKKFIHDSYSCRIGKGTSFGIMRISHFLRSCSQNYKNDCWILKLDIKGYFMAMDRTMLYGKIRAILEKNKEELGTDLDFLLYLLEEIIFNDPTKNCSIKSKKESWIGLPRSKSLFFSGNNKGFPIGNLTSQLFGNIYLDEFDHFIKEVLGCTYYGRYVDDIVIVHSDHAYLKSIISPVRDFLKHYSLELHPHKIYFQHFSKGVSFLGVSIKPFRMYAGKRMKSNFYKNILKTNLFVSDKKKLNRGNCFSILASINSHLGIMKHYQTFKLRKKFFGLLNPNFWEYFFKDENMGKLVLCRGVFLRMHLNMNGR